MGRRLFHFLEDNVMRFFYLLSFIVPTALASPLGCLFGRVFYSLMGSEKQRITAMLQKALPEKSPEEIRLLFRKIASNGGKVNLEKLIVSERLIRARYQRLGGLEAFVGELRKAHEKGKGFVVVATHLNNIEHAMGFMARLLKERFGIGYYAAVARMPTPYLDRLVRDVRQRVLKLTFIYTKQSKYYANKILREKGIIGFGADVDYGYRGIFVPFFGRAFALGPGAPNYALKYNVPLMLGIVYVDEKGLQHVHAEEVEIERTGEMGVDFYNLSAKLASRIEYWIRKYPEQWTGWLQRPWKTRPPEELEALLTEHPRDLSVMRQLGQSYLATGRRSEAQEIFKKALDLAQDCHFAHLGLGRIYSESDESEKAYFHLLRALELRPRDAAGLKHAGLFFMKQKLWKTALRYFELALKRKYDDTESSWGKGKCLEIMGKMAEAERTYKKALVINNDYGPIHLALAGIYKTRPGQSREMEKHLQSMKELSMDLGPLAS